MKAVLLALAMLVACKEDAVTVESDPETSDRCWPTKTTDSKVYEQWCQWKGYWWFCFADGKHRTCDRKSEVPSEDMNKWPMK